MRKEREQEILDGLEALGAERAPMPRVVLPMEVSDKRKSFDKNRAVFEIKWDGFRTTARIEGGEVRLASKKGISWGERFTSINQSLLQIGKDAIFDGELVVLGEDGKPDLPALRPYREGLKKRNITGKLVYFVFDIMYWDGYDLTGLALVERKRILREVLEGLPANIQYVEHSEDEDALFATVKKLGLEGIVAKYRDSRYELGKGENVRTRYWMKIKHYIRRHGRKIIKNS